MPHFVLRACVIPIQEVRDIWHAVGLLRRGTAEQVRDPEERVMYGLESTRRPRTHINQTKKPTYNPNSLAETIPS